VVWTVASADAGKYAALAAAVRPLAYALRAQLRWATDGRRVSRVERGVLDRRRLWAYRFDERIFLGSRRVPGELTIALILDLSGSMHGPRWPILQRLAVAFSEACASLPRIGLHVYGHSADGKGRTCTEIVRLATPARGPVLSLGSLPRGANNRDGHALRVIGKDFLARSPVRIPRVALHACDGDPQAQGYAGEPALEATRAAIAWFSRAVSPVVLLGIQPAASLEGLGVPALTWSEEASPRDLGRLLRSLVGGL
jgi:nitric oxide reductase activation protein